MHSTDNGDCMSKEGTGRVSHYLKYGIVRCYTMEVNYNMACKAGHKIARPKADYATITKAYTKDSPENIYGTIKYDRHEPEKESTIHFFNKNDFEAFGKGACISLLDLIEQNPSSRLTLLPYMNLKGLKVAMGMKIMKEIPFRFDPYIRYLTKGIENKKEQKLMTRFVINGEKNEQFVTNQKESKTASKNGSNYVIKNGAVTKFKAVVSKIQK